MCYSFNFKMSTQAKCQAMSERGENVKPSVTNNSGFHECSGSVGAARKVFPDWSQETMTCHSERLKDGKF